MMLFSQSEGFNYLHCSYSIIGQKTGLTGANRNLFNMAIMGIVFLFWGGGGEGGGEHQENESSMALHPINLCQNMLSSSPVLTPTRLN